MLFVGCLSTKKKFCAKSYMNTHKFIYVDNGRLTEKFFLIKDSVQVEYSGTNLYSESAINWNSCYSYSLIIKKIYYREGLQPGDTLLVRIQSFNKDTLKCIASAYGHSFPIELLKTNMQQ